MKHTFVINFLIILISFNIDQCYGSTHYFGQRQSGDSLLETKVLVDQQAEIPTRYTINYDHYDQRAITLLEYNVESVDSTANISYTDKGSVKSVLYVSPTRHVRATVNMYGYLSLDRAPQNVKLIYRAQPPQIIKRIIRYNVMHKHVRDSENSRHINYGERQSNDKLIYFKEKQGVTDDVHQLQTAEFHYNSMKFITFVEFAFNSLTGDIKQFRPTESSFVAIAEVDNNPYYNVQPMTVSVSVYGYDVNEKPSSYLPIMRHQENDPNAK